MSKQYPGGESEPGFAAIKAKYGEDMVAFCRNLPQRTENELRAMYETAGDSDPEEVHIWERERIISGTDQARQTLNRLRGNREFALEFAGRVAYWLDRDEWAVVPSVAQFRAVIYEGKRAPGETLTPDLIALLRKRAAADPEGMSATILMGLEKVGLA